MSEPVISICASANRIKWWPRFLDSLKSTKTPYEVIFCGNVMPDFDLSHYPELTFIHAVVKPSQCYQIAFWAAKGKLIHWTADDSSYSKNDTGCDNGLDIAYAKWQEIEKQNGNDGKTIIAMNPCEDGGYPQKEFHRLYGGWTETPIMAPLALVPRKYLCDEGQGYDKYFVSGQAENDICMRCFEDGGRVEMALDAKLYIHHRQCHPRDPSTGKEKNHFRAWYPKDRQRLEDCWIVGGYGFYEKLNAFRNNSPETRKEVVARISSKRLCPVVPFENTPDVCTVTQGEKGQW